MNIQAKAIDDPVVNLVATNIDGLINLDISGYGVIAELYKAARALHDRPLTLAAAEALRTRLHDGGTFFVTSGWIMPGTYPYGETDGPIGAATLGRALGLAFGARMVVLTEPRMVECTVATCRAAGINVLVERDLVEAPRPPHPRFLHCVVVPFPIDDSQAISESKRLFDAFAPKAIIAIEKNGPNQYGRYSMVDGSDNSDCVAKAARLFEEAAARGVLTIGIGDRGNEIGFGRIAEVPRKVLPFGENATDATVVDILVTAAVSNWGASGIAAALAVLLRRPDLMHDTAIESRMLHRCIEAGGVDGFTCRPVPKSDGMDEPAHVAICALLNELVRTPAITGGGLFSTPVFGSSSTKPGVRS
jgi:D-glutamate cyclase